MVNPLLESKFTVPLFLSDFKIYFHYIKDTPYVLKLARSNYIVDKDDVRKAMGAAILNLLATMDQMDLFKEFYLHQYVAYL